MSDLDFKGRMDALMVGVRFFLDQPSVDDLRAAIKHVHSVAPIVDPTAYMHGIDNLRWQSVVLDAVAAFQKALEPVAALRDETQDIFGGAR